LRSGAAGPVANSAIDAVVRKTMETYPVVRHAALAIVHGTRLVYARGYTLAEPDWPIAHATTRFRLASVSKTVTALAVFQLIEAGMLGLTDTVQSVLELETPAGTRPTDPRFHSITIQNLLEHTSGLNTYSFFDGDAVVSAFRAAGKANSQLPIDQRMADAYIASLALVNNPGTVQTYSNVGYYLLGRVVARLRNTITPIAAYRTNLLEPLGIARIRASVDLLADQPSDESRYQAAAIAASSPSGLQVDYSLMTPEQPLVASGYGDLELGVAQGSGGLSGAVTDVARLAAILIDLSATPADSISTIVARSRAGLSLRLLTVSKP
jgi:CubicO group peptidase (beta-lactamase class C family)